LEAAITAIAATGSGPSSVAGKSDYLRSLVSDLSGMGEQGAVLAGDLDLMIGVQPELMIATGAWHGDLTVWNCALSVTDDVLIWDWERYGRGVPLGYDALHYHLQSELSGRAAVPDDVHALVARAPGLLAGFGVSTETAVFTALTYLGELGRRYLTDRQEFAGAERGRIGQWLVPGVHSCIGQISSTLGRA
jgi:hypothetical protein